MLHADTCEISLKVPQLEDPRHSEGCEAFNQSIAARFTSAQTNFTPIPGSSSYLEGSGSAAYDDGHVIAVSLAFDAYAGGPHPTPWLETVTYDADQGREVTLGDLFADRSGLALLSKEVSASLATQPEMDEFFISSNAGPSAENFAAWQPSAEGLKFALPAARIGPYGAGMFEATVPWEKLRGALDPHGPLWRESAPFTWDGDTDVRKLSFDRLVSALHDPANATAPSAKDDLAAPQAAQAFLTVSAAAERSHGSLADLTEHYALLHDALSRCNQASETEKTFTFIESAALQEIEIASSHAGATQASTTSDEPATRAVAATRASLTGRFLQALLTTGSAEQARTLALIPTAEHAGTVERQAKTVVINGIRVPIKE